MKGLLSLLSLSCLLSSSLGLGTIQKVSLRPSECHNCGMTALGQLNLKICGGSLPERCCSIVNVANFDNINEGIIYDYMGEHELEDCWNYDLQGVDSIQQFHSKEGQPLKPVMTKGILLMNLANIHEKTSCVPSEMVDEKQVVQEHQEQH